MAKSKKTPTRNVGMLIDNKIPAMSAEAIQELHEGLVRIIEACHDARLEQTSIQVAIKAFAEIAAKVSTTGPMNLSNITFGL